MEIFILSGDGGRLLAASHWLAAEVPPPDPSSGILPLVLDV
ncbi:MAG: hypothetical protein M0T72_10300 [Candidatus Dormibacteraeota bacterium]|nr:hypothetical protein [Candidatus Dormibacteraeota bacterium]MDA8395608.1 hypothetical protein [Candidatus Dormibacteraeota bacterium]